MPLTHLLLICHSTQEANIGLYQQYGLTEEALTRIVAREQVRLLNTIDADRVKAILVNPIAPDAGTAKQTVGDLMVKVNELYATYRRTNPGVTVRVLDTHTDAGGAYGTTGLYYSSAGKSWITAIYEEVKAYSPGSDHGVRYRSDLGILTGTDPVAGLIELAPHDRADATKHLVENPGGYARATVRGMCKALGLQLPAEMRPAPATPTTPTIPVFGDPVALLRQSISAAQEALTILEAK